MPSSSWSSVVVTIRKVNIILTQRVIHIRFALVPLVKNDTSTDISWCSRHERVVTIWWGEEVFAINKQLPLVRFDHNDTRHNQRKICGIVAKCSCHFSAFTIVGVTFCRLLCTVWMCLGVRCLRRVSVWQLVDEHDHHLSDSNRV